MPDMQGTHTQEAAVQMFRSHAKTINRLKAKHALRNPYCRVLGAMPDRFRRAILPAQLGLRVARIATWAATLTLSAVYFRRICYLIADSSISSVERCGVSPLH